SGDDRLGPLAVPASLSANGVVGVAGRGGGGHPDLLALADARARAGDGGRGPAAAVDAGYLADRLDRLEAGRVGRDGAARRGTRVPRLPAEAAAGVRVRAAATEPVRPAVVPRLVAGIRAAARPLGGGDAGGYDLLPDDDAPGPPRRRGRG